MFVMIVICSSGKRIRKKERPFNKPCFKLTLTVKHMATIEYDSESDDVSCIFKIL